MQKLLINLSEKIIYGYAFNWLTEIIRLSDDLDTIAISDDSYPRESPCGLKLPVVWRPAMGNTTRAEVPTHAFTRGCKCMEYAFYGLKTTWISWRKCRLKMCI